MGGAALAAVLVAGVLQAVAFDPAASGCFRCPDNLVAVPSAAGRAAALDRTATALVLLAGLLVAGVAAVRWWRSAPLARRTAWPMLLGGVGVASLTAAHAARVLSQPRFIYDTWAGPVWNAQLILLATIAVGAWWRLSLPRRTADRVARSVLAATPEPDALVASLAREIGDADLVVTYRRLDGSRIDVEGRGVDAPVDRAVLRLTRDGDARTPSSGTPPASIQSPTSCTRWPTRPGWRWSTSRRRRGCAPRPWTRCRPGVGSSRAPTPSAGGSSATCTTGHSRD